MTAAAGAVDWVRVEADLNSEGYARTGQLLGSDVCSRLAGLYSGKGLFRSRVVMARHNFGQGEYQYFSYPLPGVIDELRGSLYPRLARIANTWAGRLKQTVRYPDRLDAMLRRCHEAGQTRPTPLMLKYGRGDYNCLHQDLYGEHVFPLQVAVLLSEPGADFKGGEFVLVQQRPRMQSRAQVVPMRQGEGIVFAVNHFPRKGTRGDYRVALRHGVSTVREGKRFVLGLIFHDAA